MGVSGPYRSETLESLRRLIPVDVESTWPPPFDEILDRDLLARAGEVAPERGDANRLSLIAWWGGAICWLTAPPGTDIGFFEAAGAFNVGVATFDTMMDRGPETSMPLAAALKPHHLERVLKRPSTERFDPSEYESITDLFHIALSGFSDRWNANPAQTELGLRTLSTMYRSEVDRDSEPWAAKSLPSVFLGMMGTDDPAAIDMHRVLGRFLAAWDDWMDLDEDLLRLQPNRYLGNPRAVGSFRYLTRGARLVASRRASEQVRRDLSELLIGTFEVAEPLDPVIRSRLAGFMKALLT